jgi:hypothetical protein
MTPDQLLGLQRHARARTASLSPDISIENNDAVPTVIASGTQESVPITVEVMPEPVSAPIVKATIEATIEATVEEQVAIDEVVAALQAKFEAPAPTVPATPVNQVVGAFVGFALFGAWTLVEIAILLAH